MPSTLSVLHIVWVDDLAREAAHRAVDPRAQHLSLARARALVVLEVALAVGAVADQPLPPAAARLRRVLVRVAAERDDDRREQRRHGLRMV